MLQELIDSPNQERHMILISMLVGVTLLTVGCVNSRYGLISPTPNHTFAVDRVFQNLYNHLGGMKTLGPAISPVFFDKNIKYQYLESSLLMYNPDAPRSERVQLVPLGVVLGMQDPPVVQTAGDGRRYINGHFLHKEFEETYDTLGGAKFVGLPLTEMRFNAFDGRVEQYFENLGFYRLANDPPGTVKLMAYGAMACDFRCRYEPDPVSLPVRQNELPEPFASAVNRLGRSFVGNPILGPVAGPEGNIIAIFENIILYANPSNTSRAYALPVVELLGNKVQPPVPRIQDDRMTFFETSNGKGYNIPNVFINYMALHGGLDIFGNPITEVQLNKKNVYRQCFKNICLDYFAIETEGLRIRPAPLGISYKNRFFPSEEPQQPLSGNKPKISVFVWESSPVIPSNQTQTIFVSVFEGRVPLSDYEPVVTLTLPSNKEKVLYFAPTRANGQTSLRIDPFEAPNGTSIPYKVCVDTLTEGEQCVEDSYFIWGSP